MSSRFWITSITLILLAVVVFFGRNLIVEAWGLMGQVNIWILLLLIPIQFISYYAIGEVMFSYLRSKGDLKNMSRFKMARISLELNFVNHIVPVPAAAGFSYLGWMLKKYDVGVGRATMAQLIRYVLSFLSFVSLLIIAVVVVAFDYKISKSIIISVSLAIFFAVVLFGFLIFAISSKKRVLSLSKFIIKTVNKFIGIFNFKKKKKLLESSKTNSFFIELHQDYVEILKEKKILLVPFAWAILNMLLDAFLILVAFWALGFWVNPAALFIAFCLSSIVTLVFSVTPGGAGVYETVMIAFLASTGVPPEVAVAGTLLARAALLLGTIGFGYLFYQLTINKYGKAPKQNSI